MNVTDRIICNKNFTGPELQQFREVIILNYLAEFNIGLNFCSNSMKKCFENNLDEIDIYDVIGIMSAENDRYFLKTKIGFNLYHDEEKMVFNKWFF